MRKVLGLLVIVVLVIIAVGFSQGWINFSRTEDKATIELDQQEMRDAAEDVARSGGQALREAGESVREAGEALRDSVTNDEEQPTSTDP